MRRELPSGKTGSSPANSGTSNLLTATVEPTQVPTTKPTSSTSKSPAPLAGLIAGLGAAALLIKMRR